MEPATRHPTWPRPPVCLPHNLLHLPPEGARITVAGLVLVRRLLAAAQRHRRVSVSPVAEHHDAHGLADGGVADDGAPAGVSSTSTPSKERITSPASSMPASLAGPSGTSVTSAPRAFLEPQRLGHVRGHVLDAHAEPAAAGLAEFLQLVDHAGHHVRGHREADADGAAIGRQDRGVHADHLAVHVEQRPARVAAVDGGVGLDVVVIGARQRRPRAETIPAETEKPCPSGLPMAITQSPTRAVSLSPKGRRGTRRTRCRA
jgi:hypothetical protein